MTESHSTRIAWIGLATLTVVWGLSWSAMKLATRYSGPFTFAGLRFVVGTAVLFVLLLARRKNLKPPPLLPTLAIGLCQTTAFNALEQWALVSGGAGKISLLAYTMPFWVVPLAWWWVHEKPGWIRWASIALAAVGYVCVIEPWQPLGAPASIAKAIAGGLSWAAATVIAKRLFQQHPEIEPLRLTAWQMLIGTLGLVVLALATHQPAIDWTAAYLGALLYTGLLASGLGWFLWAIVVQRLPANVAGLAVLAVPVAAVLFGWGLLAEIPSVAEWAGIVLIVAALAILQLHHRMSG
jgi:drug/metabolite transporter (DMT)-like permease